MRKVRFQGIARGRALFTVTDRLQLLKLALFLCQPSFLRVGNRLTMYQTALALCAV